MKAVASFGGGIHLILGGKDKDSDYGAMSELLKERVKAVYTIGTAAEKIERQLHGVVKMVQAGTMQKAVQEAAKAAVAGDVVLLSPACSSFDQFENYEHRGRVFREIVNELS
jgi:UDP-N-acetylmuramoylalanine--D-glutamate ligase